MYTLTNADLKKIAAWFHQDVPCKNGVSLFDVIAQLSADNQAPVVDATPVAEEVSEEVTEEVAVEETPIEIAE